jgi:hypothetical protein
VDLVTLRTTWEHATMLDVRRNAALGIGGGITRGRHRIAKPIIAAVNGLAVGGGFELALSMVPNERESLRQMSQQSLKEVKDFSAPDIVGVLSPVQTISPTVRGNFDCADGREPIAAIPLAKDRRLAPNGGVIANSKGTLDELGDTAQGPKVGGKTIRSSPLEHHLE